MPSVSFQSSIGMCNNLISIVMGVWLCPCEQREGYLDLWRKGIRSEGICSAQGLPTSGPWTYQISGNSRLEVKYTINVMRLNHPETIAPPNPWSMEKLSSMKSVPGAKKVGDHWLSLHWVLKEQALLDNGRISIIQVEGTHLQYQGPPSSLLFLESKGWGRE